MAVITISRQLGSWGDEVAQAVASRLNYRLTCRELINQAALRAGAPEMALAAIDDLGLLGIRPSPHSRRAYQQALQSVVEECAGKGDAVIIGRAGQVILRGFPDTLHVKIIAPASLRAERISAEQNISLEAAAAQIAASDKARSSYLRRWYNARWDDPELYDLILNTQRLSADQAACLICQALAQCIH
ncbi:MAG: cytidylate kinase-like family protein [Anaerolineales bacterium]